MKAGVVRRVTKNDGPAVTGRAAAVEPGADEMSCDPLAAMGRQDGNRTEADADCTRKGRDRTERDVADDFALTVRHEGYDEMAAVAKKAHQVGFSGDREASGMNAENGAGVGRPFWPNENHVTQLRQPNVWHQRRA